MAGERYLFIPVLGDITETTLPLTVPFKAVETHFDEAMEHVSVLFNGHRRDMFVGETSAINGRHIRNIRATEIYRANALSQNPGLDPEDLPAISGPAVLFPDVIVWR